MIFCSSQRITPNQITEVSNCNPFNKLILNLELACAVMVYHWTQEQMDWIDTHSDTALLLECINKF